MRKQLIIFVFVTIAMISCEKKESYLDTISETMKATPNAENLLLINAEQTLQLQSEILTQAEILLEGMNVEEADITSLKRLKLSNTIDSTLLIVKLDSLISVFNELRPKAVKRIFDEYSIPSGMTEDDQYLIVGGDVMIDKSNPDNALMLSNIIRVYKGMEPIGNIDDFGELTMLRSKRGFTTSDDKRWDNGVIPYQFAKNITEEEKTFIRNCYNDWTIRTDRKIKFQEVSDSWWNNFRYDIGLFVFVKIKKETLGVVSGVNAAGAANTCGKSTGAWIKYDPNWIMNYRTVVHEMGHIIGLKHEHQRPDRDKFLRVNITGSQFDKIEEKYSKFLWWTTKTRSVTYTSNYDFMSIMHYENPRANPWFTNFNGNRINTGGTSISNTDAEFVKSMY